MKSCLALVFVLLASSYAVKDCTISGLPGKTNADASVTIISVNNVTSLNLSCRCSVHSPMWQVVPLDDWQPEFVSSPIGCMDNGGDCTPVGRTFIAERSPGMFTYIDHTFIIDQTTVLKCYRITGTSDSPDETAIVYFNHDEEATEVTTIATTELVTTSVTTELPSPTETSLYIPSTTTTEKHATTSSILQRQPVTTPSEPPTDIVVTTQRQPSDITSLPDPSMPSEMTFINAIENELGGSAFYLLPIVLVLVVMVVVLFGCLILIKYKRKKAPVAIDVEKSAPEQDSNPDNTTKHEILLPPRLQEPRIRSNSNTYVTFSLSPSVKQHPVLGAVAKASDNMTDLKQVGVDGSSFTELCNPELSLTIPVSLLMQGSTEILRTCEPSPSIDSRTIAADSTNF